MVAVMGNCNPLRGSHRDRRLEYLYYSRLNLASGVSCSSILDYTYIDSTSNTKVMRCYNPLVNSYPAKTHQKEKYNSLNGTYKKDIKRINFQQFNEVTRVIFCKI